MTTTDWTRPDVEAELAQLKDFQLATVKHAFQRLYLAPDSSHRFLVADEVGLGKTMVAKGVIAKAIDHLWDSVGRIDVIYVCSNADIARQNVNRLNVMGRGGFSNATRLTMLPVELSGLRGNKVNFVSFTPGTSFDMKSGTGLASERALLYLMLKDAWNLGNSAAPINVLSAYASSDTFRNRIATITDGKRYPKGIDPDLMRAFRMDLDREAASTKGESLQTRFDRLCGVFSRKDTRPSREDQAARNAIVGEFRALLANTCIRSLEPDLVILDEFQRFKEVLTGDSDAALLARELFNYSDGHSAARVLLLSATPYKMYTVRDEAGDVDHYEDFVATLGFLQHDAAATNHTRGNLSQLRKAIYAGPEARAAIPALRAEVEQALRKVIARTERLAMSADRNGMLKEIAASSMSLKTDDVSTYCALQKIGRQLEQPDTVEFWKAAPYLLNFMERYQLKHRLVEAIEAGSVDGGVTRAIKAATGANVPLMLSMEKVEDQQPLHPPHPRMRWLLEDVVDRGAWKLLWIPPSLPYYGLAGVYADTSLHGFTKRLVFSAWKVAPKAIATLLSYEAERRMFENARKARESRTDQLERTRPLLQFRSSHSRLSGMAVLGLMYPSITLARAGDPLHFDVAGGRMGERSLSDLLLKVQDRLAAPLEELLKEADNAGAEDERWYWAAPILLDLRLHPADARGWLRRTDLVARWGGEEQGEEEELVGWHQHVDAVLDLLSRGKYHQLGKPPVDLVTVLALIAVAGPAVVSLRALSRSKNADTCLTDNDVRDAAARVAHGFRALFNLPEVISLLRGLNAAEPYWLRALEYCANGCLQAVLDEYVHVALGTEGLAGRSPGQFAGEVASRIRLALGLRTSRLGVDNIRIAANGHVKREAMTMRARFAMRFGDESSDDEGEANRKESVRTAFNSPFWPFVLASTSVGQEGLDFHLYCHAVVHWNIPSNPVDMEQREGRVHRFKGHAVRRNVAKKHGRELGSDGAEDPWSGLFDLAVQWRDDGTSDLVPFWIFAIPNGAAIERHVPNLALSRDSARYAQLRRSLAVYRMVFGQPRQEELLEYLAGQTAAGAVEATTLNIDLTPR